eukprot:tig00000903_g5498.t1
MSWSLIESDSFPTSARRGAPSPVPLRRALRQAGLAEGGAGAPAPGAAGDDGRDPFLGWINTLVLSVCVVAAAAALRAALAAIARRLGASGGARGQVELLAYTATYCGLASSSVELAARGSPAHRAAAILFLVVALVGYVGVACVVLWLKIRRRPALTFAEEDLVQWPSRSGARTPSKSGARTPAKSGARTPKTPKGEAYACGGAEAGAEAGPERLPVAMPVDMAALSVIEIAQQRDDARRRARFRRESQGLVDIRAIEREGRGRRLLRNPPLNAPAPGGRYGAAGAEAQKEAEAGGADAGLELASRDAGTDWAGRAAAYDGGPRELSPRSIRFPSGRATPGWATPGGVHLSGFATPADREGAATPGWATPGGVHLSLGGSPRAPRSGALTPASFFAFPGPGKGAETAPASAAPSRPGSATAAGRRARRPAPGTLAAALQARDFDSALRPPGRSRSGAATPGRPAPPPRARRRGGRRRRGWTRRSPRSGAVSPARSGGSGAATPSAPRSIVFAPGARSGAVTPAARSGAVSPALSSGSGAATPAAPAAPRSIVIAPGARSGAVTPAARSRAVSPTLSGGSGAATPPAPAAPRSIVIAPGARSCAITPVARSGAVSPTLSAGSGTATPAAPAAPHSIVNAPDTRSGAVTPAARSGAATPGAPRSVLGLATAGAAGSKPPAPRAAPKSAPSLFPFRPRSGAVTPLPAGSSGQATPPPEPAHAVGGVTPGRSLRRLPALSVSPKPGTDGGVCAGAGALAGALRAVLEQLHPEKRQAGPRMAVVALQATSLWREYAAAARRAALAAHKPSGYWAPAPKGGAAPLAAPQAPPRSLQAAAPPPPPPPSPPPPPAHANATQALGFLYEDFRFERLAFLCGSFRLAKALAQAVVVHAVREPVAQAALLIAIELLFLAYCLWSRPYSIFAVNALAVVVSLGQTAAYVCACLYYAGAVGPAGAGAGMTLCGLLSAAALLLFALTVQLPLMARAVWRLLLEAAAVRGEPLRVWLSQARLGFSWWRKGRRN